MAVIARSQRSQLSSAFWLFSGAMLSVFTFCRVSWTRGTAGSESCWFGSVLLGGEFLHGLDTRWKLSWRYELAGSFPVRRPGVNQGMSQWERPLLPYLLLPLFFFFFSFIAPLLLHPLDQQRSEEIHIFLSSPISPPSFFLFFCLSRHSPLHVV